MEFSRIHKQSLNRLSPNGLYVAGVSLHRITVREVETMSVAATFAGMDKVDVLEWSADSLHLLCLHSKIIQIFSLVDPAWICKIVDEDVGFESACWTPDSRHVITISDFEGWLNVWSLSRQSVDGEPLLTVTKPKAQPSCIAFSENKKFVAMITRDDLKDSVLIYECKTWELLQRFNMSTYDCEGVLWGNSDRVLIIWDSALACKVLVYSVTGALLKSYEPYTHALGVWSIAIERNRDTIAVGYYDGKIRIIESAKWEILCSFEHQPVLPITQPLNIFQETLSEHSSLQNDCLVLDDEGASLYVAVDLDQIGIDGKDKQNENGLSFLGGGEGKTKKKNITNLNVIDYGDGIYFYKLPVRKNGGSGGDRTPTHSSSSAKNKPLDRSGISAVSWSSDGLYLASKSEETPGVVWIWNVCTSNLICILVHKSSVKDFKWAPRTKDCHPGLLHRLAIVTGESRVFLWSPQHSAVAEMPSTFAKQKLNCIQVDWNSTGDALLLQSNAQMCIAYFKEGTPNTK